ncbi:DUF983 domain-containing protein [Chelativorans sp. AA-79]|uniref:DUF983 domain-containing protein n=1 Tax=Chelativorans sp. AA-79 TaxID=3028735 RepID=UPI0023F6B0AA|nr:DUF983 domain-containing protein [Chelativorans sp. AA-79]WEX11714.1 DUF983 domain-containing protein [Chelativorans sp. AA-79]
MEERIFGGADHVGEARRSVFESMRRGFFGKCPHCGKGRLFRSFLKTVDHCAECGEEMSHHRADDLPAYLVIVVVGHIVVGAFMGVEAATAWSSWVHLAIWVPITILMSLALIGPIKGAVVGLQWALRMHGFGGEKDALETHPEL